MEDIIDFADISDIRILLIDSNPEDAQTFISTCDKSISNTQISVTKSLRESLKILKTQLFDMIFMDLNITDSVGPNSVHEIHKEVPEIPLIVTTGIPCSITKEECQKFGALGVIQKSSITGQLVATFLEKMGQDVQYKTLKNK